MDTCRNQTIIDNLGDLVCIRKFGVKPYYRFTIKTTGFKIYVGLSKDSSCSDYESTAITSRTATLDVVVNNCKNDDDCENDDDCVVCEFIPSTTDLPITLVNQFRNNSELPYQKEILVNGRPCIGIWKFHQCYYNMDQIDHEGMDVLVVDGVLVHAPTAE
jgi:hypothetical protein